MILSDDIKTECAGGDGAASRDLCTQPPMVLSNKAAVFRWAVSMAREQSFDWFVWANDHTFFVTENLITYIRSLEAQHGGDTDGGDDVPIFAGKTMVSGGRVFNSGAAGILLNRQATSVLTKAWERKEAACFPRNGARGTTTRLSSDLALLPGCRAPTLLPR